MRKKKTVEVVLRLPKAVADLFRTEGQTLEQTLTQEVMAYAKAEVEDMEPRKLMDRLKLTSVFREYGVLDP